MINLPDSAVRERAATATDRNIVVTAGAGTGKTTLLVDRLTHLLMRQPEPLSIGEIVALTFTNKAANEMKLRLRDRLSTLVEMDFGSPPLAAVQRQEWEQLAALSTRYHLSKDRLNELAEKALAELEKSQIGTIHSFAAHLLRIYPVETGVDPAFLEDEGTNFKEYFKQEWAAWLDRELGPAGANKEIWRAVLRVASLEDLRELAVKLAGELIPLDDLLAQVGASDEGIALPLPIQKWARGLSERANTLRRAHPKTNTLERMLEEAASYLQGMAEQGLHPHPSLPLATEKGREGGESLDRDVPRKTSAWSEEDHMEAKHIMEVARSLMRLQTGALPWALRLLVPFASDCRRRFVRSGYVSFDGLLARARDLVRDHPLIRRDLKRQFRALLVDEFQDTDPVQYEMLLYLAEAFGREERDWRMVRLEPGKLFIVGDPKQSIYAFRRADMEAYDAVVEERVLPQSPPGEQLPLQTNFRSHAALLTVINAFFARVLPEKSIKGVQPKHDPLHAFDVGPVALSNERVEIRLVRPPDPETDADTASRVEAEELARWLSEDVLGRQELLEHGVPVKIQPRHVAILFRTFTKVWGYLEAFRRYDIPCLTEGEKHFYERQEVIDAVNLLRAATNPHDHVALIGVLRSSLAGLTDAHIEAVVRENLLDYRTAPESQNWQGEGNLGQRLAPVYSLLRTLNREVPRLPLSEVMDALFETVPLLELAAASIDQEQAVANLMKLRDLVAELAERSHCSLQGLIAELTARVSEPPDEAESSLAEETQDGVEEQGAVRLLSIHKAKGLEFPLVVLAGLHLKSGTREPQVFVQHDWTSGIVGVRVGELRTLGGVYVSDKLDERQRAERTRVLYVGMTRAKRRLVLSTGIPGRRSRSAESLLALVGKGMQFDPYAIEKTTSLSLDHVTVPVEVIQGSESARRPTKHAEAWHDAEDDVSVLQTRWTERTQRWQEARTFRLFTSPSVLIVNGILKDRKGPEVIYKEPVSGRRRDKALLIGTLAHRVLERWDFSADPRKLDQQITNVCRTGLSQEWAGEAEALETELREIFKLFAASSPYAELGRATILGREIPFIIPWSNSTSQSSVRSPQPLVPSPQPSRFRLASAGRRSPAEAAPPSPESSVLSPQPSVMEGVIDLVYRLDGQVWIADYKTDSVTERELTSRAAESQVQARIYREAVSRCLGLDKVNFQFLFLRTGLAVQA